MRLRASRRALSASDAERLALALAGVGLVIRLVWTTATPGLVFDITSYELAGAAVTTDLLHLYGALNPEGVYRWPYPAGYLPWLGLVESLGLPMRMFAPLPAVIADTVLAWVVWSGLSSAGASPGTRLAGVALVALGPSFAITAGVHGQIDAVAVLPAVIGLLVWERGGDRRAFSVGLLIGAGTCIKLLPILTLLALIPTSRSWREGAALVFAAGALPAVALLPFLVADLDGVIGALSYSGMPGMGGISMLIQPELARTYLLGADTTQASPVTLALVDHGIVLTGCAVIAACGLACRWQLAPRQAAVLVWGTFLIAGTAFSFHYVVGALVFLILAGHLRAAAALQAGLLIPSILFYGGKWPEGTPGVFPAFVVLMALVWAGMIVFVAMRWRTASRPMVPGIPS